MANFVVGSKMPKSITADQNDPRLLSNAGGGILFYGDKSVTSEINEGELEAGESVLLEHGVWLLSESESAVALSTISLVEQLQTVQRLVATLETTAEGLATKAELVTEKEEREEADAKLKEEIEGILP